MLGQFQDSNIAIDLQLYGVSEDLRKPLRAIVDTGFSGYLTLPFVVAFPLGLVLKGEQSTTLANGQVSSHFVCLGTVEFLGKSLIVPIDVQPSGPILAGMQLLKKFEHDLIIDFVAETFEFKKSRSKPRNVLPKVRINI